MNRWLSRANRRMSLKSAAFLLVMASLMGQVLGFIRIQTINANFSFLGPHSTDTYFAAFKIPDFFFYTIAAGALGVALMPFLADKQQKGDRKGMWELMSSMLNLLAILMFVVGVIIMVFAEPLIRHIVSDRFTPEQLHTAATIMRWVAFNPLLFTISGILTSLQQTFGRFFFYALAPAIYNITIIVSVYVFRHNIGIVGLGIGALIGAILQLFIVLLGLWGLRFRYRPSITWNLDFKRVLKQLPPRSIDQGIDAINSIVETNRARVLGTGNIAFYENAYTLHLAPILLVGTTIATAAFPRLNDRLSQGRPDLFRRDFLMVLRAMIWIILPVVVVSFFARGILARIIFKHDAPEVAIIFGFLTGAIFFRTLYAIISRYFYSQKDTKTPLLVSLVTIALNIVFAFTLARPSAYGIAGLAIAQTIVATVEVLILVVIMLIRDHRLFDRGFWGGISRILSVTGFTIVTTYIMVALVPLSSSDKGFMVLGTKLLFIVIPTFVVHIALSALFGLEEAQPVVAKLRQIVLKPVKIQ